MLTVMISSKVAVVRMSLILEQKGAIVVHWYGGIKVQPVEVGLAVRPSHAARVQ